MVLVVVPVWWRCVRAMLGAGINGEKEDEMKRGSRGWSRKGVERVAVGDTGEWRGWEWVGWIGGWWPFDSGRTWPRFPEPPSWRQRPINPPPGRFALASAHLREHIQICLPPLHPRYGTHRYALPPPPHGRRTTTGREFPASIRAGA